MSEPAQVTINDATFSRYECQISCAIKLWVKPVNVVPPSDDTLGSIVRCLRGKFDETAAPCEDIVRQIQHHSEESVRAIYMKVYSNRLYWEREANIVYDRWSKQNDVIMETYDESDLESGFGTTLSDENLSKFSEEASSLFTSSDHRSLSSSKSSGQRSMRNKSFPVTISYGSISQDHERYKTTDERYYLMSFSNPDSQKNSLSCQPKERDERYYRQSSYGGHDQNKWSNKQSLPSYQVSPTSGDQCDTSCDIRPCTYEGESSTGGSTRSEDRDKHCNVSIPNNDQLTIAYAKHQMMVTLMEEFYTSFDPQWHANVRSHVTPNSRSSRCQEYSKPQDGSTQDRNGKRPIRDREPSPGDNNNNSNNGKKRRGNPTDTKGNRPDLQFACPFHKYDPRKFCSNPDTGTRYRSCSGPGFSSISKLKQHLRRTHEAPIQCPRCWLAMKNMEEMGRHLNAEVRCEQRSIRPEEGISQEKMQLICNKWGINWDGIFKIIFPGAPIPSPYYEPELAETNQPSSSQPNGPRSFEAYNRVRLPLLVEASLRPAVNASMEPIEEQLRTLIVDIVRDCQSTVAHDWELMNSSSATMTDAAQPASRETDVAHAVKDGNSESSGAGASNPELSNFVKPPELDDGTILPAPVTPDYGDDQGDNLPPISEWGYGGPSDPCQCSCHDTGGFSSTLGDIIPMRLGVCTNTDL